MTQHNTPKYIFKRNECVDPPRGMLKVIPNWKQPKCVIREWINKLSYIHIMEYYSAIK